MPSFADSALIKQIVTYFDIISAALLFYDYLLTLPDEITYVWPSRMNLGKILFLLTRYPVFADTTLVLVHQFQILNPRQCGIIFTTIGWNLGVGVGIAEVILTMRTWVIWSRDRRISWGLGILMVILWVPIFFFLNEALSSLEFTVPPPNTPGCFLLKQKNILFVVFILIMTFETTILILTLIKGIEHFRATSSPLIAILYRDGFINYVYLFILSLINLVVITTAPHGYTTLLTAFQRVVHAILSGRILLHLRRAADTRLVMTRTRIGGRDTYRHTMRSVTVGSGANWNFRQPPYTAKESFMEGEEEIDGTETWFGRDIASGSGSGGSGTLSVSELSELDERGGGGHY